MAIISFSRPIVMSKKNVKNLIYAVEHPVNASEMYKNVPKIREANHEDLLKLKEKYCK